MQLAWGLQHEAMSMLGGVNNDAENAAHFILAYMVCQHNEDEREGYLGADR